MLLIYTLLLNVVSFYNLCNTKVCRCSPIDLAAVRETDYRMFSRPGLAGSKQLKTTDSGKLPTEPAVVRLTVKKDAACNLAIRGNANASECLHIPYSTLFLSPLSLRERLV